MTFLKLVRLRLLTKKKDKASDTCNNLIFISILIYLKYCELGVTPLKCCTRAKGRVSYLRFHVPGELFQMG